MKRIFALGISTLLAVPLLSTVVVLAENSTPAATTGTSHSGPGTADTKTTAATPPVTAPPASDAVDTRALQTRLDQRKAELKINLSATEKLNIQAKCKTAQGLVSSVKARVPAIETSRSEAYANIVARLTDLSTKLKNKGADTKALDADITALQAKITAFNTDLAAYKQDVSDLADMDCKTNPDGFKASLLAARTALDSVYKDAGAVRSYVNDTIKPELNKIRNSLATSTAGGNQ